MFLIGTLSLSAQKKTNFNIVKTSVRGVVLSYNKVRKIMTITIPRETMRTSDPDMYVLVELNKEFSLKLIINDVPISMNEVFFKQEGHFDDYHWAFYTTRPGNCKEIKKNSVYQFTDIEIGEEYILSVSNLCDNKYETDLKTGSIIIN